MPRNYRKEYDNYHSSPTQKRRRAARNKARRQTVREGRASKGDGRDVHHRDGNPRNNSRSNRQVTSQRRNRSFPRNRNAGKR